jgi:hypothetical protein
VGGHTESQGQAENAAAAGAAVADVVHTFGLGAVCTYVSHGDKPCVVRARAYALNYLLTSSLRVYLGLALLCVAPVFVGESEHALKWLFIANGIVGIGFLIGNGLDIFIVNVLASFVWGFLFPISAVMLARVFRNLDAHQTSDSRLN